MKTLRQQLAEMLGGYSGCAFYGFDMADKVLKIVAASGIEAATAGETSTQIEGSTEGKSPTAKPGRPTPGSEA